ncbi:hypothetical protein LACWKB10_1887 [Lactobacillus sp. wkB10]|nr:hypothetical protein LACWKB10_1887 [Lactobacillus sp. wkB10]
MTSYSYMRVKKMIKTKKNIVYGAFLKTFVITSIVLFGIS